MKLSESKPLLTAIGFSGAGVEVNRVFQIKTDPLQIYSQKLDEVVEIPVPISHVGSKPINCCLISSHRRLDMVKAEDKLKLNKILFDYRLEKKLIVLS